VKGPFPAYDGHDPYIFVCYAHEDADVVFPHVDWLRQHGVNIWYDEGISPGELWRDEVVRAMEGAHLFLFFVSPRSIASIDCLREVDFALDHSRVLISVYLTEITLSSALAFRIGNVQALRLFEYEDADGRQRLLKAIARTGAATADQALAAHGSGARRVAQSPWSRVLSTMRRAVSSSRLTQRLRSRAALLGGVFVSVLTAASILVPAIGDLERQIGLRAIFTARGAIPPPDFVTIVSINQQAALNISLPRDPEKFHRCVDVAVGPVPATHASLPPVPSRWPRCLHARLVERLTSAGSRVIAFDMVFRERPPLPGSSGDLNAWQDQNFAVAIAAARSVVVAKRIEVTEAGEMLSPLSAPIEAAALAAAPFPLITNGGRIARFSVFRASEFATPTLPTMVLQAFARDANERVVELTARSSPAFADLLQPQTDIDAPGRLSSVALLLRHAIRDDPDLARRLETDISLWKDSETAKQSVALIAMYGGEDTRILNLYGPSGTIPALSYDRVLAATPAALESEIKGKAVFVGYSEAEQPEQVEHFATAFSSEEGIDISGVEIAATAFANLLERSTIREVPSYAWSLLTLACGLVATLIWARWRTRAALLLSASGFVAYCIFVYVAFTEYVWIPFVVPAFIAMPAAAFATISGRLWSARRRLTNASRAMGV
jgi:adenylate cyclase